MWKKNLILRWIRVTTGVVFLACFSGLLAAQESVGHSSPTNAVILVIEGNFEGKRAEVEVLRAGAQTWDRAYTNQVLSVGDRIRVGENGRLAIRLSDQSIVRIGAKSEIQVQPPRGPGSPRFSLGFFAGLLHFFHRDAPTDLEVVNRTASAAVRGTEFEMEVADDGTTILTVIDGEVQLSNALGPPLSLKNLQQGIVEPGKAPVLRPAIDAINNIIQWTFYYPGILDTEELPLNDQERAALSASLGAYRSGDLLRALAEYPAGRIPQSDAERIYLAGLRLSVGQIDEAQRLLDSLPKIASDQPVSSHQRLADALRQLIAAVKLQPAPRLRTPELATEWLAESYYQQSLAKLPEALAAARRAVAKSQQFGFGWERVAELEFSFGRVDQASKAVERGLQLSPRNAQAFALNGFLYAARNKIGLAISEFQRAIEIDGALANAWLGRGLCRIRQNQSAVGREDLLIAAALEPQRSFLRSYLGKAWSDARDRKRAEHELELAKQLDPRDPTAWLYSALLKQQNNQINEAVRDLEYSQDLSTNRGVYRSQFLLDQDRAVSSANLAHIYRDAGMKDWSVEEAGRAVASDYANYSAHLFLANSYDELRDPNRISLRYETPAESEYLIANLLAPVGAGTLSQSISQGEYSKLFERDRLHVVSTTEYLSRGAWYENGAQFGTFGNSSYALEGVYRTDPGQRANNDFEERELRIHVKQQLTPQDSIYLRAVQYESVGGDRFLYYDPTNSNPGLRVKEEQSPALVLGYHHEWNPGSHLILAGARFDDTYQVNDPQIGIWRMTTPRGVLRSVDLVAANLNVRTKSEIYSVEAQQIWEGPQHATIVGTRFQAGNFNVQNLSFDPSAGGARGLFDPQSVPILPDVDPQFSRLSVYGYHFWRPFDPFLLVAGLSYDHLRFPENIRSVPMTDDRETVERVLPKIGFVWTPAPSTTIRAAYTQSLGGASLDQSIRLEPTQVAGFNQAFRSIIPESIVGANSGDRFETYDLSFEKKFGHGTYLSVAGEILDSTVPRTLGAYAVDLFGSSDFGIQSSLHQRIDYRERSLLLSLDQLIGKEWVVGARYRLSDADFDSQFSETPALSKETDTFQPTQHFDSLLHQIQLRAIYNHRSGFFAEFDSAWYSQRNRGYTPELPGDDFWHLDVFGGYRFAQRRAQITLGILNLTDRDYRLNPLNLYNELPHKRTFLARCSFSF